MYTACTCHATPAQKLHYQWSHNGCWHNGKKAQYCFKSRRRGLVVEPVPAPRKTKQVQQQSGVGWETLDGEEKAGEHLEHLTTNKEAQVLLFRGKSRKRPKHLDLSLLDTAEGERK